ncbi:hypothetical protein [Spirosoma migulaei]
MTYSDVQQASIASEYAILTGPKTKVFRYSLKNQCVDENCV